MQQGHTDSLVDLLAAYLQRQPNDITAREILSNAHSQLKQYPLARLQLTTALRQLQGDDQHNRKQKAKLLNNIGYCFDRQNEIEASAQWFSRSIEVDPTFDVVPYHNLARVYVRKRHFAQAWRILERCIEAFPDNHETPAVQAYVLAEQDRNDEAIELLKTELATGKATPNSYALLGWFLTDLKPDPETAEQVLSDALKRYPQHPTIINNLAYVLLMQGRPVEARTLLSSLNIEASSLNIESNAIRPEDRIYLTATWGLLYLWEGDITAGRQSYERARLIAFESPQKNLSEVVEQKMHLELARAFLRQHHIATAISEIRKGLSIKEGRRCYEHDLTALIEDYSERNLKAPFHSPETPPI